MELTPIKLFGEWFDEEIKIATARIPSACCFSTMGTDGFPNARFVSLKEVTENGFIVTGPLASRKGIEVGQNNKVALTFWWPATERQVRIQGMATKISEQLADKYFAERERQSQIVSIVCEQGQEIKNLEILTKEYEKMELSDADTPLSRPNDWSGFLIEPIRIEFLEFKPSRFHDRKLYELVNGQWIMKQIQP